MSNAPDPRLSLAILRSAPWIPQFNCAYYYVAAATHLSFLPRVGTHTFLPFDMLKALSVAAVVLPFVSAAPVPFVGRACDAIKFSPSVYSLLQNFTEVYVTNLQAEPGQTLTATVVASISSSRY